MWNPNHSGTGFKDCGIFIAIYGASNITEGTGEEKRKKNPLID